MEQGSSSAVEDLKEATREVLAKLEQLALGAVEDKEKVRGKRTRTRTRKGKSTAESTNTGSVQNDRVSVKSNRKVSHSSTSDPIDYYTQFVLEMLRLPQSQWIQHLRDIAVRKGVIHAEKSSSVQKTRYTWNGEHEANRNTASLIECLNGEAKEKSVSESRGDSSRGGGKGQSDRKKRYLTLEASINEQVDDKKLHVSLNPNRIRSEAELDKALKKYSALLEKAGLGYEDEAELFVTKEGRTAFVRTNPEVMIRNQKLRRCGLNGDIVRVFVFKSAEIAKKVLGEGNDSEEEDENDEEVPKSLSTAVQFGFVIRIVKMVHERTCVGQFNSHDATARAKNLVFFPRERGIHSVHISARCLEPFLAKAADAEQFYKELPQRIFEVELTSVNSFHSICNGRILSDMGVKGNLRDENACILLRHGFAKHNIDRLERLGETYAFKGMLADDQLQLQEDESKAKVNAIGPQKRRDLTDLCIFTIDPATARDLDDAVSCRTLENGNVEVGIHISDVTHYVLEDSDLDQLVQQAKTTSVYMVDQVYHMLPSILCQTCSLLPGEDKRAVSVFVEMNANAEVVSTSYTRSLINSCCQLSYEQAQKIIDDEDPLSVAPLCIYNDFEVTDLRRTIKTLHGLSRIMRERRIRHGALKFDKPKYYFRLDDNNQPQEIFSELSKPANHLIEEFMILANEVVGKFIYDTYPEWAILRQHSPPKLDQMAKVRAFFRELGFPDLNYHTAKEINASMEALLAECDNRKLDRKGFELVLNCLLAKPMNRAQYFCTGDDKYADKFDHFALSIPFYTHFTSPIRRYPDILVHRLLIRAINGEPAPKQWKLDDVMALMGVCNRQKMNSRYASEDSSRLFFMHFLRAHFPKGRRMKATVYSVLQRSVEVKLWETGDELNVHYADIEARKEWRVAHLEAGDGVRVKRSGQPAVKGEDKVEEEKEEGAMAAKEGKQSLEAVEFVLKVFSNCFVIVTVDKDRLSAVLDLDHPIEL